MLCGLLCNHDYPDAQHPDVVDVDNGTAVAAAADDDDHDHDHDVDEKVNYV